jgi:hypothetical protein
MTPPVLTVDVAHPPRRQELVEAELDQALRTVRLSPSLRVLKVVHGYGSSGKGGSTKTVVRNWAFRHRRSALAVIHGEDYSLFHQESREMLKAIGPFDDPDLRSPNRGVCLIWVK